jgi:hypothetical protein
MYAVLILAGLAFSHPTQAQTQAAEDLFAESVEPGPLARTDPSVVRKRFVTINLNFLKDIGLDKSLSVRPRLRLNLFADTALTARLDRSFPTRYGTSWNGHIEGISRSDAIFVTVNNIVSGTVTVPGATYIIEYAGNGVHAIYQIDDALQLPDGPAVYPPTSTAATAPVDSSKPAQANKLIPQTDSGATIDVMVVYTAAARAAAGGTTAMQAAIDSMISTTNQAYTNSSINTQLNLVHTAEVTYVENGDMGIDLDKLTYTGGGNSEMDEVQTLRNTYGADLVALLVENGNYCGIAWIMSNVSAGFAPYGYSVTLRSCGGHVFAHELGHNEGMQHDWYVDPSGGAFTYSHGHVHINGASSFRTIMSYRDLCDDNSVSCPRITYFSNPNVTYNGVATGVAEGTNLTCTEGNLSNPPCDADNRKTLNNAAFTIANFRESLAPDEPSNLNTSVISHIQINLSWQDNSNNETGFKIERKLGTGGTYSLIATVGAGVTSYSNTGISPNTQYCYRVRASGATADSGYSNESCATTPSTSTSATFRIERGTGLVNSDGSFNCGLSSNCFNSGTGADLAERIETSEPVEPGDLVEPDPTQPKKYRKTQNANSDRAAGVISQKPGMTLNNSTREQNLGSNWITYSDSLSNFSIAKFSQPTSSSIKMSLSLSQLGYSALFSMNLSKVITLQLLQGRPLLALTGRVYVKATNENGPIRAGDLVVSSSKPGYAMRCLGECAYSAIGKALSALDQPEGTVLILVMSR